jgi:hypothetical protein
MNDLIEKPTSHHTTAELRKIALHYPNKFARYHAARTLGRKHGLIPRENPFDAKTTPELTFIRDNCKRNGDTFFFDACNVEINHRRDAQISIVGDLRRDTRDVTYTNGSWNHPDRPIGGDWRTAKMDECGRVVERFPFNSTVVASAA